jgi:hypothetical protein
MKNPHPEYIIDDISGEKCRNQRYYDWQEGFEAGKRCGGDGTHAADKGNNRKGMRKSGKTVGSS